MNKTVACLKYKSVSHLCDISLKFLCSVWFSALSETAWNPFPASLLIDYNLIRSSVTPSGLPLFHPVCFFIIVNQLQSVVEQILVSVMIGSSWLKVEPPAMHHANVPAQQDASSPLLSPLPLLTSHSSSHTCARAQTAAERKASKDFTIYFWKGRETFTCWGDPAWRVDWRGESHKLLSV